MKKLSVWFCLLSSVFCPLFASAQVPQLINYQGRLLNGTNLVNGNIGLSLRLFNTPSGGSSLYEDSNTVTVVDGLYSTFIGDNPTNSLLLLALTNAQVWVEVAVNGTALSPRERLASGGYSLATRGINVNSSGAVGIGTISPSYKLEVAHGGADGVRIGSPTNGLSSVVDIDSGNGDSAIRLQHAGVTKWSLQNHPAAGFVVYLNTNTEVFNISTNGQFGFGGAASAGMSADFYGGRLRLRQAATNSGMPGIWLYMAGPADDRALIGMNGEGYVGFWGDQGAGWDVLMNVTNGHIGLGTTPNGTNRVTVAGGAFCSGNGTTWVNASDKNLKEGFMPVDANAVLEKVAALPLTTWHYKEESAGNKHLGPMAQDFHAAFGLGYDDKSISTVDASGVALAAIQALNTKIEAKDAEIESLKKQNAEILQRLRALEAK